MIPGVLYQLRASIYGPTAGNSPFDSAIEKAALKGYLAKSHLV